MKFSLLWKGARFISALAFMLAPPVHAVDGSETTLAVGGIIKLEYFDKRTTEQAGKVKNNSGSLVDEAVLKLAAKFGAWVEVALVLATEKIHTSEFEPVFVKEFILAYRFDQNRTLIVGRMDLPFGVFQTATVTDPQTKKIGKAKTDIGLGIKGKNDAAQLEWNVIAFADDYRTPGPGADGVTANLLWKATNRWTVGAGVISRQYARTNAPALANIHVGTRDDAWELTGEYVAALDNEGGEKPKAWSVDGAYQVASQLKLGVRHQAAERRFVVNSARSRYNEWALALKYYPYPQTTIGIEYLAGGRRGQPVDFQDVRQITAQVILSF